VGGTNSIITARATLINQTGKAASLARDPLNEQATAERNGLFGIKQQLG
jgi:hypothetical protein